MDSTDSTETTGQPLPDMGEDPPLGPSLTTLQVSDWSQQGTTRGSARMGVPLPRGLSSGPDFTLSRDDQSLPTQARVLSRWDDDSVRWLLLDTQVGLDPGASDTLTLHASAPPAVQGAVSVASGEGVYTLENDRIRVDVGLDDGAVLRGIWFDDEVVYTPDATSGPYATIERNATTTTYHGAALTSDNGPTGAMVDSYHAHPGEAGYAGALNRYDPFALDVHIEESGPLRAVIRVTGPLLDAQGNAWGTSITRVEVLAGHASVNLSQTLVTTGDEDDQIVGYGFRLPLAGEDGATLGGAASQLAHLGFAHHQIDGVDVDGRGPGWIGRDLASGSVAVSLRDMAELFPKALRVADDDAIWVELYPQAAPAWNLARYSDTVDGANGETDAPAFDTSCNRGAQGFARTDAFSLSFSEGPLSEIEASAQAARHEVGPMPLLASPQWISDARVVGIGPFAFDPEASAVHRRIDFVTRVVADFMRFNQRSQFGWFGIEDYGDIRGRFTGGAMEDGQWHELGRYGWSGNSGEPSNQLWVHFLRTGDGEVFRDAVALAQHSLDAQMIHYGTNDDVHGNTCEWDGLNRKFAIGSMHRHGRQAWSGYGQAPEYSHVGGIETYYYLSGDTRALDALYEAAQFIVRYDPNDPGSTAFANGIEVLSRAVAVFGEDDERSEELAAWQSRLDQLVAVAGANDAAGVDAEIGGANTLGETFNFFIRVVPGLMAEHERSGSSDAAAAIFRSADILIAGGDPFGQLASAEDTSPFFQIGVLAYAASIAEQHDVDGSAYRAAAQQLATLNAHLDPDSICAPDGPEESSSTCFDDAWLAAYPQDWRSWQWSWETDPSPNTPGILWLARQLTYRNDFMQDYHSYRLLSNLAMAAGSLDGA